MKVYLLTQVRVRPYNGSNDFFIKQWSIYYLDPFLSLNWLFANKS